MTSHGSPEVEVRYDGFHDAGPAEDRLEVPASPEFEPPDQAPETCSLCCAEEPRYWYELEPPDGAPAAHEKDPSIERWWAICAVCHTLLTAVDSLRERVVDSERRSTFRALPQVINGAELHGDIEKR